MNSTWRKTRHLRMVDRGFIVYQDGWYLTQLYWNALCVHFSKAKLLVHDCPYTVWPQHLLIVSCHAQKKWQLPKINCSTLLVLTWLNGVFGHVGDCLLFCGWLQVQYATCAAVLSVVYHLQSVFQWISATFKTSFTNSISLYIAAHIFTPNHTILWFD